MCTWGMLIFVLWNHMTASDHLAIGRSGSSEVTTTQTSTCIGMERRVPDSTSLRSSITEEDLEDARQRLLLHQEEDGTEYTTPLPPHQPVRNQTQYGSVSTIQSSQTTRPPATPKRYRLPFLILLVFDFGLIVFLSIICSVVGVIYIIFCFSTTVSQYGQWEVMVRGSTLCWYSLCTNYI